MNPTQASERFLEVTQLGDATGLMVLGGLHPKKTDVAPGRLQNTDFAWPQRLAFLAYFHQ